MPCLDGEIGSTPATVTSDRVCLPRAAGNCARASLLDQSVCVACKPGYWLSDSSCVAMCPEATPYPVTSLGSCRECPAGHVRSASGNGCQLCSNSQCLYCLPSQTSECSECEAGQVGGLAVQASGLVLSTQFWPVSSHPLAAPPADFDPWHVRGKRGACHRDVCWHGHPALSHRRVP